MLVCQQGAGAGWRPCRAARGAWGIPPHCPTCQPEALLGACRDRCWVLHSWGAHSSRLAEEIPAGARSADLGRLHTCWPQGDGHVCARMAASKLILAGATSPAATAACGQVTRAHGRAARGRAGPSHLSLPEAGARDSNGAFRLVRASYCR